MNVPRRAATVASVALLAAGLLTGCAGGSASGSSASGTAGAAPATAGQAGARGGPGDAAAQQRFAQIRSCLQAAGIAVPTPSGTRRSLTRTPGVTPSPRPSGSPGFRGGGFGRMFADPKVQAALKACGIALPTPGARRPGGSPSPTA
jgi:hypothetical protein